MTISKFLSIAAIIFSLTILGAEAKPPAGSSDVSNHVNKGVELAQQHKYDEAMKEFNAAIEANPKSAKAYLNRGTAYRALQKYDEAMQDFAKAIEIAPKDEMGYLERGQTFVMQKQYSEALVDLGKAAELKPDNTMAIRLRGFAEIGLGDWDKAAADFTAVLQKDQTMRRLTSAAGSSIAARRNTTRPSPITTRVWRSNPIPTFTRSGATPTSPICKITRKESRIINKPSGSIPTITIRNSACSTRNRPSPPKTRRRRRPLRLRHRSVAFLRH